MAKNLTGEVLWTDFWKIGLYCFHLCGCFYDWLVCGQYCFQMCRFIYYWPIFRQYCFQTSEPVWPPEKETHVTPEKETCMTPQKNTTSWRSVRVIMSWKIWAALRKKPMWPPSLLSLCHGKVEGWSFELRKIFGWWLERKLCDPLPPPPDATQLNARHNTRGILVLRVSWTVAEKCQPEIARGNQLQEFHLLFFSAAQHFEVNRQQMKTMWPMLFRMPLLVSLSGSPRR